MRFFKTILCAMLCGTMLLCACAESGGKTDDTTDALTGNAGTSDAITTDEPEQEVLGIVESDDENIDFYLNVPSNRDIRILQMTDTQITDPDNARSGHRVNQITGAFFGNGCFDDEKKIWRHMDEAVANMGEIDLIVVTGDMIYGETDDDGKLWSAFVQKMDSYQIPWTVVWGNHDNESAMGVLWQIEQIKNSMYGVFERGDVTGNSNFNIAVRQGDKVKYMLYMFDTNGCRVIGNQGEGVMEDNVDLEHLTQKKGIYADQIEWFETTMTAIESKYGYDIPVMQFFHIPPKALNTALRRYRYQGEGTLTLDQGEDFGFVGEYSANDIVDGQNKFFKASQKYGVTNMFFGHYHDCNASIVYQGIRMTYGSKTGTHSYHDHDLLGSTQIVVGKDDNKVTVTHVESKFMNDNA